MTTAIGILGVGAYLPPHVRTNDWWPAAEVARWREQMAHRITRPEPEGPAPAIAGVDRVLAAMAAYGDDPFRGAVERRVMAPEQTSAEMEAAAARDALARAGVAPEEVDVLLGSTMCPDVLAVNQACAVHRLLGLREDCFTLGTEAICNAFALHVTLAQSLLAARGGRYALLVFSSAMTRVQGSTAPHSAWFGDGAAAVVLGPVSAGRGVLAVSNHADGTLCRALVLGVPGGRWWEAGRTVFYSDDHAATRAMLLTMVEHATSAVGAALTRAGLGRDDVDFYAAHQGTPWLGRVTREACGLTGARSLDTFPVTGNMSAVNIPFILATAEREGTLRAGDVVVTFAGGTGMTWSSVVLRWGR